MTKGVAVGGLEVAGRTDKRVARRVATRRRLIEAATSVFAEKGFAASTMDEIADAAGVSKGSVFYNFESKTALFTQVLRDAADRLSEVVQGAHADLVGWPALEAAIPAVLHEVDRDPAMFQLISMELFRTGRAWNDDLADIRERLLAPLVAILVEVRQQRLESGQPVVEVTTDISSVAVALLGAACFSVLDRQAFRPDRSLDQVQQLMLAVVAGLRPTGRTAPTVGE